MGQWLKGAGPNFPRQAVAQRLGVSERTLRNWERGAHEALKPLGRPATSPSKRFQARLKVARELRRQGLVGWRPVAAKVGSTVSTRLVQECVRELKRRHAQRRRNWLVSNRVSVEVLSPNVIWTQDATHVGRMSQEVVQAEVIKDRATLGYVDVAVGPQAQAEDVLKMLEGCKKGPGLPLVWATDNGQVYRDRRVEEYLKQEKVVHLISRPRVPQDNAAAEKGIRELKAEADLGKGVKLSNLEETARKLAYSWNLLDHWRLRGSKGYRTADDLKTQLPMWEGMVERGVFFEQACKCMKKAVKGGRTAREKRQSERQAVYKTLQRFQLITRTRGGNPLKLVPDSPEDIL